MNKFIRMLTNMSLSAVFILLAGWIPGAIASDELIVELSPIEIVVYPSADSPNPVMMMLRVMAPDGTLVMEERSDGEAISWAPTGMDDGLYHYEAVVDVDDVSTSYAEENVASESAEKPLQTRGRTWGVLDVTNGAIIVPQNKLGGDEEARVFPTVTNRALRTIEWILDAMIQAHMRWI